MIVLLDHDDSFVHTLARYVTELGGDAVVINARKTTPAAIVALRPARLILSPGPGSPESCSVALDLLRLHAHTLPIFGICLGHQCVAVAHGALVGRSAHPLHGSSSAIHHDGAGIFTGLPSPLQGGRYHSLAVDRRTVPPALIVTATSDDGEVMGLRHREWPTESVQFHPESVLSEWGHAMLARFLDVSPVASSGADSLR